jgi:PHD/YefM family antitoxin component YafN of YafNO toxin-antitoxin module
MNAQLITTTDLRDNLSDTLDDVNSRNMTYLIVRRGEVEGGFVSKKYLDEFEDFMSAKNPKILRELAQSHRDIKAGSTISFVDLKKQLGL